MTYTEFFSSIKSGGLSGAYLLHGEEEYVKRSALTALVSTVDEAARELNVQYADDVSGIIAACETLPFFADRRIVIARAIPTGDDGLRLRDYLVRVPDTAVLIFFIRSKADGTTGIFQSLKKDGRIVEFAPLEKSEAVRWVMQQARGAGVTTTERAAAFLVELVGTELNSLNNEFQKAAAYAGEGNEVTREIINSAVTRNLEFTIFNMLDYFLAGKTADGLRALDTLLKDGENPIGIASFLSGRFKALLLARECIDARISRKDAQKRMGGSPYAAGKAYDAAGRYTRAQLIRYISLFSDVLYQKISSGAKEKEVLQLALISCSMKD